MKKVRSFVLFTNGVSNMWYTILVCLCVFSSKFVCRISRYIYNMYICTVYIYMSMVYDCTLYVVFKSSLSI